MAADALDRRVAEAFTELSQENPLRGLHASDLKFVIALLKIYEDSKKYPTDGVTEAMEEASAIAKSASDLAKRIDGLISEGKLSKGWGWSTTEFSDLPVRLLDFSSHMDSLTNAFGKQGHKAKTGRKTWLIITSEFVRLKTSRYHDEHLAELFQLVSPQATLEEDFSGGNIGKLRNRFKKEYPAYYAWSVDQVRKAVATTCLSQKQKRDSEMNLPRGLADALANYSANNTDVAGAPGKNFSAKGLRLKPQSWRAHQAPHNQD